MGRERNPAHQLCSQILLCPPTSYTEKTARKSHLTPRGGDAASADKSDEPMSCQLRNFGGSPAQVKPALRPRFSSVDAPEMKWLLDLKNESASGPETSRVRDRRESGFQ